MNNIITLKKARELCIKEECGYCLTHDPPITCCERMFELLLNENGLNWCKKNISEWTLNKYLENKE